MYLWWSLCTLCLLACHGSYRKRLRSLLVCLCEESTGRGVNQRSKYVTQVQQQRPELPTVTPTWHACKYNVHKLHQYSYIPPPPFFFFFFFFFEDAPLVELCTLYLHACPVRVIEGHSGLCCCTCVTTYVFRALINSLEC